MNLHKRLRSIELRRDVSYGGFKTSKIKRIVPLPPQMTNENEVDQDDELFEHYRIVADPGQALLRIDKFLMDRLPNVTRTRIQEGIHAGFVRVNEKNIKPNHKVHPGDVITVAFPE